MKKLYLVRHAKSSWEDPTLHDMDRSLQGRGINDAYNTATWLLQQGEVPEQIYSSPATRALHTALIFARVMNYPFVKIKIDERIYEASQSQLLEVVRTMNDKYSSIMLFGHNPTITHFVNRVIEHTIENVPTTGVACLSFDVESWADVNTRAELVFFDYPKWRKS